MKKIKEVIIYLVVMGITISVASLAISWLVRVSINQEVKSSQRFIECINILEFEAGYERTWAENYCFNLMVN